MNFNPEVSSRVLPDGTEETVYQNGIRCIQNGNVASWYYPGQTRWHYREVVNPVNGSSTSHTQEVDQIVPGGTTCAYGNSSREQPLPG